MVDIETLATCPNAIILSIGACNIYKPELDFYAEVNVKQPGRTFDGVTFEWWRAQEVTGIAQMPIGTTHLGKALWDFIRWLQNFNEPRIWAKGSDFDPVIIRDAIESFGFELPWKYNHVRDCRTIFKCFPLDTGLVNQFPHNALEDAKFQARRLLETAAYYNFTLA